MPDAIHENTTDADREAIEKTRERRAQVAKDAAAKKGKRSTERQKGTTETKTTQG